MTYTCRRYPRMGADSTVPGAVTWLGMMVCIIMLSDRVIEGKQLSRPMFNNCQKAYIDLVFILDASTSVTEPNFQKCKEDIKKLVEHFSPDAGYLRVGCVTFSTRVHIQFHLKEYRSKRDIFKAVDKIPYQYGSTNTADALKITREIMFTAGNGNRPQVSKIAVLITDGVSNINFRRVTSESAIARDSGIVILAVGIGLTDTRELKQIASNDLYFVENDYNNMENALTGLLLALCPGCDEGWSRYQQKCLQCRDTGNSTQTWRQSQKDCEQSNSYLVTIDSKRKEEFTLNVCKKALRKVPTEIHIGLMKGIVKPTRNPKDLFRWHDGRPLTYSKWAQNKKLSSESKQTGHQPNGGSAERCVSWNVRAGWQDIGCVDNTEPRSYVCEKTDLGTENKSAPVLHKLTAVSLTSKKKQEIYQCSNKELISSLLVCDGQKDCYDGTDEDNCGESCTDSQFMCDSGTCISLSFYCDFHRDCNDNSDEKYCVPRPCLEDEWQCDNKECIPEKHHCDIFPDCIDGSDEKKCEKCANGVSCYDGTCIPEQWMCDDFVDCDGFHGEDEDHLFCYGAHNKCSRAQIDLVFMVDTSESIKQSKFREMKRFTRHFTKSFHISPSNVRVGYVTFNTSVKIWFTLNNFSSVNEVTHAIKSVTPNFGAGVDTGEALHVLRTTMFSLENGARKNVKHIAILFTDGKSLHPEKTYEEANLTDEAGIKIITIGIGSDVNIKELIAISKNPELQFACANFEALKAIAVRARIAMCSDQGTNIESECLRHTDRLIYTQDCVNFACPDNYFKCHQSYCISINQVCDGENHCSNGEDEVNCGTFFCPTYYRCRGPGVYNCIHPSEICDGNPNCKHGDDELFCAFPCPEFCSCHGGVVECSNFSSHGANFSVATRKLDFSGVPVNMSIVTIDSLFLLAELNLSNCKLSSLPSFRTLKNLYKLDLSLNCLSKLKNDSFAGLGHLKHLNITGNIQLEVIEIDAFVGLDNLITLDLSNSSLRSLKSGAFRHLGHLSTLNMSNIKLSEVAPGAFDGLKALKHFDIRNNPIETYDVGIFKGLMTEYLYVDSYRLCCENVRPNTTEENKCFAPKDSISSCRDLLQDDILRIFLWILGLSALVGNLMVILCRVLFDRRSLYRGYGMFVTNLGISDFLMGVYMLIIATADASFRGEYVWEDLRWRHSTACNIAGFLSTLSSEASTIFICLITLDRFLVIRFPFGQVRFTAVKAGVVAGFVWIVTILVSVVPLLPMAAHWKLYNQNGVCLALPLTTARTPGWAYSVGLFIGFNFCTFSLIAAGQVGIYKSMIGASMIQSRERRSQDIAVAKKLSLVVITDFLCWFPVCVMGLLAATGTEIDGEVYAWTAVFVLPINSALNPFLYTLMSLIQRKRGEKDVVSQKSMQSTLLHSDASNLVYLGEPDGGMMPLGNLQHQNLELYHLIHCLTSAFTPLLAEPSSEPTIFVKMNDGAAERICVNHMEKK